MKKTLTSYIIGFALSLVLTLAAAKLVWIHIVSGHTLLSHDFLVGSIIVLAVLQLLVQLVFFMHLADESGPRWKLSALISFVGIILIVVVGSIWIMGHLNYNMMASPSNMNDYIQSQDGF